MQTICELSDGKMQEGVQRINLDVKFLRGKNDGEMTDKGKFVKAGSTMILVDGENSGEIFTTDIDGYQGSTFKSMLSSSTREEVPTLWHQRNEKLLNKTHEMHILGKCKPLH